jgi:polyhydroxyalkanoate synthesis repressor PhaR
MAKTRIIKKYPNRRLYDTVISSYVTIEDIRQLVIDGEDFEVQDAKNGADLTRQVLLQIISEREEQGQPMLSTRLLSQLIRFYGDQMQGFMGSYLERSLQTFLDQQQQFRSQLNSMLGQSPLGVFQTLSERNLELFKQFQNSLLNVASKPGELKPNDPTSSKSPRK